MNRINIEFSIEIERVLPTRPQAKALIGSRPYPRGGEVVGQNQGHKDDRKVCLPTVRKREIVGGEEKGAPPKTKFFGATQQSHEIGSVGGGPQTRAHVGQCKSS